MRDDSDDDVAMTGGSGLGELGKDLAAADADVEDGNLVWSFCSWSLSCARLCFSFSMFDIFT